MLKPRSNAISDLFDEELDAFEKLLITLTTLGLIELMSVPYMAVIYERIARYELTVGEL